MIRFFTLLGFLFFTLALNGQISLAVEMGYGRINEKLITADEYDYYYNRDGKNSSYATLTPQVQISSRFKLGMGFQLSSRTVDGYATRSPYLVYEDIYPTNNLSLTFNLIPEIEYQIVPFWHINTGLSFGWHNSYGSRYGQSSRFNHFIDETKSATDFGLNFNNKFHIKNFYINVAYFLGLQDTNLEHYTNNLTGEEIDPYTVKNRIFRIGIGYRFDLKKISMPTPG